MPMSRMKSANQRYLRRRCVSVMAALALMPGGRGVPGRQRLMICEAVAGKKLMALHCPRAADVTAKLPMALPGGEAVTRSEARRGYHPENRVYQPAGKWQAARAELFSR